jgi:preprotein translocase subunit SecG
MEKEKYQKIIRNLAIVLSILFVAFIMVCLLIRSKKTSKIIQKQPC